MGNYHADSSGHVFNSKELWNLHTKEEAMTPDHQEIINILKHYQGAGKISDVDLMKLKSHALTDSTTLNDYRLMNIVEAIENKQGQLSEQQFNIMLGVPQIQKTNKLLHSMSTLDTFGITVALCLGVLGFCFIVPKLAELLKRSTKAVFIFMTLGFGTIIYIVR